MKLYILLAKCANSLSPDGNTFAKELNRLESNFHGLPRWKIVNSDGRNGWLIPSNLEIKELAARLFEGLPQAYQSDLWQISETSISPMDLSPSTSTE